MGNICHPKVTGYNACGHLVRYRTIRRHGGLAWHWCNNWFQQLLEMNGAKVYTARSGSEALQVANEHQFEVVLSDVAMPEMDGFEFLRKLRELVPHHDVPVLALTGFGRPEDIERAKQAGFFSHITKPFDLDKLAITWRAIPRKQRGEDGSASPT